MIEEKSLAGRTVLLGVGGGIAVYRVVELARLLIKQGAKVHVIMTRAAQAFVSKLTFEVLTGNPVHNDLFALADGQSMGHISLIRAADLLLIAPCTENLMAKLAHGIADDFLTTSFAARQNIPTLIAPAMNPAMWLSPPAQRNQALLKKDRIIVIAPEHGDTACGEQGVGRMADPKCLLAMVIAALTPKTLAGQYWVINAGRTEEPWDAVRVLTNRASGSLGSLMASQAAIMGAKVTLVAGPKTPKSNHAVTRVDVQTADDMLHACEDAAAHADVFVASAAISDYRFAQQYKHKLKRQGDEVLTVSLLPNPDIVAHIAQLKYRPRHVIAFAAESSQHCDYARIKLEKKGVDAIIANDVNTMGKDVASGWWLTKTACCVLAKTDKKNFSQHIISCILELDHHA
ncbi:MAG: bifunctional phosphopantothenoylcysteine decarboxylase/phosphopantothenate--cysteine ligase CoaBC [Mariprofundaceae bacterium]|nr:bifunctional phosphopantothenoylcysteine decarboxylase/phosphopantothenate--cysteine ligase CoaBC [Mariprofundaceae bacterium]